MKNIISFLAIAIMLTACSSDGLETLDLRSNGANITIKAPAGAEIKTNPIGFRKEITITQDKFDLILLVGEDARQTSDELKKSKLASIKAMSIFSRIVEEDANGFIYEINQGEEKNYDFRYAYIQNGASYDFRRNLIGDYTLDEVKKMYKAVQQK